MCVARDDPDLGVVAGGVPIGHAAPSMRLAWIFSALAVASAAHGFFYGGWQFVALWPAASFGVVAAGYFGLGPAVLGKDAQGARAPWAAGFHLPFFGLSWLTWMLLRFLGGESAWDEVSPGVYVGRRCVARELPAGLAMVVDVTAEFLEPAPVQALATYRCLPTLDVMAPPAEPFAALVEEIAAVDGPVFIHCAAGHGRSATVAAAVLVRRGVEPDIGAAVATMKAKRPRVRLVRGQRAAADALVATFGSGAL